MSERFWVVLDGQRLPVLLTFEDAKETARMFMQIGRTAWVEAESPPETQYRLEPSTGSWVKLRPKQEEVALAPASL
jgi:hypothetical protein